MMWTLSPGRTTRCGAAAALFALAVLTATHADAQCVGDCSGDGTVAINELISGVNIALGNNPLSSCPAFDVNQSGMVEINELISAVNNALNGCVVVNTPTPTITVAQGSPTPTRTAVEGTPTFTPIVGADCGNGTVDFAQGETCDDGNRDEGPEDSCPANCRIAPCERSGDTLTADVVFATDPADLLLTGLTVFVRYPDGTVD